MNKNTKRFLLILLCVLLVVSGIVIWKKSQKPEEPEEEITYRYGYGSGGSTYSGKWTLDSNVGYADYTVAEGSRAKRTQIKGDGKDTYSIFIYMCGSDLESKSAMGVYDLQEMASAELSDKVNVIVYTGGTKSWHIKEMSAQVNQIYRVRNGQLERLVDNAGNSSMVDPNTLVSFLEWGVQNFPADRYSLIFWDHGSGTISGYGYDEKYPRNGSMGLDKIDQALTTVGVDFDFIGFDACLMATTETGLMLAEHADYMIASEESEPGTGWYYTNWLTKLSGNTSMATLDIGMNIVDDFVAYSQQKTRQSATLSVIDLAEMETTVPSKLSAFSKSANGLLENKQYKTIATARGNAREFASDSRIDQVDLVDMAAQIDIPEAKELTDALLGCIKYNKATSDMANSYGLSIWFPYRSLKYTNTVLNTYKAINMSEDYSSITRNFATYATSGQVSSGGNTNPYSSLSGQGYSNQSYQTQSSSDLVMDLLNLFLTGSSSVSSNQNYSSYYTPGFNFLFGRSIDPAPMAEYIAENHFDADLNWKDGKIHLTSKQWEMVEDLKLAVFVDDGSGYIDLGTDNVFEINDNNDLLAPAEMTWLGLSTDGNKYETMPYFHLSTTGDQDDYTIIGRVPCLYNGELANLIVMFTDENPNGSVEGLSYDYSGFDTITVGKRACEFEEGDTIQFVTDYYDYDGNYNSSWTIGDPLKVTGNWYIGDLDLSDSKVLATYEFTDIYQQHYWTAPVK